MNKSGKMLEGMSNRCYHKARAISKSYLHGLRTVPAGAKVDFKGSTSTGIGTAAHTLVLEPELFEDSVMESKNKTSNSKDFQFLLEEYPDKTILPAGGIEQVKAMTANIRQHPKINELLSGNLVIEPSFFWKDQDTGIWCKTRPDAVDFEKGLIFDLKFLAKGKSNSRKFSWAVKDFGYDLQTAWNILGIKEVTGKLLTNFHFVIVETDEPYKSAVYNLDDEWMGDSLYECKRLLQIEAECREKNFWPAYDEENVHGEELFRGI